MNLLEFRFYQIDNTNIICKTSQTNYLLITTEFLCFLNLTSQKSSCVHTTKRGSHGELNPVISCRWVENELFCNDLGPHNNVSTSVSKFATIGVRNQSSRSITFTQISFSFDRKGYLSTSFLFKGLSNKKFTV